jgi:multicomponent Na+:H+ antiporter subunit E
MQTERRSWLVRTVGFLGFWLILFGVGSANLVVAALAALAATWVSLRLLPSGEFRLRPVALTEFVLRFLYKSIVSGIDVAWRALDPRLPLRPGFVVYHTHLPPGVTRNAFCIETSLLPGTLPCGSDEKGGGLKIHCLDVAQPVVEQLAAEEALFTRAFGGTSSDD